MNKPGPGVSRRDLLTTVPALALTGLAWSSPPGDEPSAGPAKNAERQGGDPRIGLALGAGGANGLAHISMLEVLDRMQLRPHRIAGSSIGAVLGAMYASGMSAADIRALVERSFVTGDQGILHKLMSDQAVHWLELVELEVGSGGLLDSRQILSHFYSSIDARDFADLQIRLDVVTGDLWGKEQVVLNEGPLLPAIQGSMAIPGIFEPVEIEGRVLVDGGAVNPVPWDLLLDDCDIVIAIDVSGVRGGPGSSTGGYFDILFNTIKLMQAAIVAEKMRHYRPDIFIAPQVRDIRALEFYEAATVFEQAMPAQKQLEEELTAVLARR